MDDISSVIDKEDSKFNYCADDITETYLRSEDSYDSQDESFSEVSNFNEFYYFEDKEEKELEVQD